MFSVVIPTIWSVPSYTLDLVNLLVDCKLIDDIIIIDNAVEKYCDDKIYHNDKITYVEMPRNIFVNPAWNLGVNLAKNEHVIISNDDLVIEPTEILEFLLRESKEWDVVGLSPDAYEDTTCDTIHLTDVTKRTYGWGCFMSVKKSKWVDIPSDMKIFYGDDFIIRTNDNVKNLELPFKVKNKMSASSSSFAKKFLKLDRDVFSRIDFSKYNTLPNRLIYSTNSDKVSVIMPSYLGDYEGARSNPIEKFNRAVKSFLQQTYNNKELVIVSDGCDLTIEQYESNWKDYENIKLVKLDKNKSKWPGTNRQSGIDKATGIWITYLDTDDILHHSHLTNLMHNVSDGKDVMFNMSSGKALSYKIYGNLKGWVFVNNIKMHRNRVESFISKQKANSVLYELDGKLYPYIYDTLPSTLPKNALKFNTARIVHKKTCDVKWTDRSARGEDTIFADALKSKYDYKIINSPTYIVCHIPNRLDI